jgi:signal transduction histidine kinase/ActR/RegA family two-component response regulator
VANGGAAVVPDNSRVPEWKTCVGATTRQGGAIYAPIAAANGPGLLVLCAHERGVYSAADQALVTKLGLLVSQTLAAGQRRRLAEAVHRSETERKAAVEANEIKSQFLANMSHVIRTPLNGVVTVAALLERTELQPRQREMVSLILESGRTLERLLGDILDLSKIEAGKLTLHGMPFNLTDSLASICQLFAAQAAARNLAFNVRLVDRDRAWLKGDSDRVRQVVTNLLSNAIKFTVEGSVSIDVDILAGDERSTVIVRVSDTGCGFSPEGAASIFGRFQQADGSITRRFGGTGLGLAISRALAVQMGGDITACSTVGQGSDFEFRFDAAPAEAPSQAIGEEGFDSQTGARILVAEDNANNRTIIGMILELIGAEVTYAEDGQKACIAYAGASFDLVLMDMQMPVLDGLSATRNIRALERERGGPATPIVVLSANAMLHQVQDSMAAGADAHVSKPIDPPALLAKISELIRPSASVHHPVAPAATGPVMARP